MYKKANILMKNGIRYQGGLNLFKPLEGWLSVYDPTAPMQILLSDIKTAEVPAALEPNLLARAINEGWNGK